MDYRNIFERALSTLIQTFAGSYGSALVLTPLGDWTSFKLAVGSSIAAALLSVRKNVTAGVVESSIPVKDKKDRVYER